MTYSLINKCAKNYYNRTFIVPVIAKNVVTCFFLRHSVVCQCFDSDTNNESDYIYIFAHRKDDRLTHIHIYVQLTIRKEKKKTNVLPYCASSYDKKIALENWQTAFSIKSKKTF